MTENAAPPPAVHNLPEFTVSEISHAIKRTLEEGFSHVRVRGEVSGFKRAASGHLYFSLKDEDAVLDAVCWRGTAGRLSIAPEDGLEVVATGRVSAYSGRSRYQIIVDALEVAGEGALLKLLEERRKKLAAEGLFDAVRKRPLPYLPNVIGVVTSPTGAVIRDILHRLADRFPRHVVVWPVLVQGEGAAEAIAGAIAGFNALEPGSRVPRPDLLIVARGGGSLEDLWAFNEENVVRAAAASEIPLIAAVGHETDTTLIDFAADQRAPTPTAAAEMAVPVRSELLAQVIDGERRLFHAMARGLDDRRIRVEGLARGLPRPGAILDAARQSVDDRGERLDLALKALVAERRHDLRAVPALQATLGGLIQAKRTAYARVEGRLRDEPLRREIERGRERTVDAFDRAGRGATALLERLGTALTAMTGLLDSYSFQRVLERGFVLVRDARDQPVTSAAGATPGLEITLSFHDGDAAAVVGRGRAKGKRRTSSDEGPQGSLL